MMTRIPTEPGRTEADVRAEIVRRLIDGSCHDLPALNSSDRAGERVVTQAEVDAVRAAFISRALNAIADIAAEVPEPLLADAVASSSDYETLLRGFELALSSGTQSQAVDVDQLRAQARLRGVGARNRLLNSEGGTWSVRQVADHLHLSRQAVDERRKRGKLLGLHIGKRAYAYPAWQFDERGTLPGLEPVLAALGDLAPWTKAAFMLNPNLYLSNQSPIAEMRWGNVDAVVDAARAHGEHGSC